MASLAVAALLVPLLVAVRCAPRWLSSYKSSVLRQTKKQCRNEPQHHVNAAQHRRECRISYRSLELVLVRLQRLHALALRQQAVHDALHLIAVGDHGCR